MKSVYSQGVKVLIEACGLLKLDVLQLKLMNKPAIQLSEADGANDFPARVARGRGRRRSVIERDARAVAVLLRDE
jgi:hypothetical protein